MWEAGVDFHDILLDSKGADKDFSRVALACST